MSLARELRQPALCVFEAAIRCLLKQFAGETRANELAPLWAGDRYAIYEQAKTKQALMVLRLHLSSEADAARMFGGLSQVLESRYDKPSNLLRRPNYFQFETPDGGVFLRCRGADCVVVDGASRETYDAITRALDWPAAPGAAGKDAQEKVARIPPGRNSRGTIAAYAAAR